jgi:hypothetical protein
MANNSSLYGSTPSSTGNISSSNLTTLYSGNPATVPATGNLVVPGSLTVNGCVILSDCQTFSILPHTSNIIIGEAGGTTTFQSQLLTANYAFPVNDGTSGQVLTTNGSGDLVFVNTGTVGRTYNIGASTTTGGADFDLVGSDGSFDTIKFAAGTNMTITATDNSTITFTSAGAIVYTQNASSVSGGANLNLVGSDGSTDSIKFASGSGIVVTRTDADTITISNNSPGTTYTQNASATTGGANLNLVGSDSTVDPVKFASGTGITVSRTDADTITITNTAPDTNTTYTQNISSTTGGANLNLVGSDATTDTVKFANGTGVTVAYTDASTATVSIGQSVATSATPTFSGLTLNGSTSGNVVVRASAVSGSSQLTLPAAVDVLVARNTTDTLTNKTISGTNNTLTGIGNASLVNSSITLGTTTTALGATSLTLGGLTSVAVTQDPTTNFELATKQYVDNLAATGTTFHTPVYLESPATAGNLTTTYNNGTAGVGATLTNAGTQVALTIDTVLTTVGMRVLIYNQTNAAENGVYTVTNVGSGSTNWVLTRATDADSYGSGSNNLSQGSAFFVQAGADGAGETYICNTAGTITFGTTAITFAQISSAAVYTATTPIAITGTNISLTTVPITLGGTGETTATAAINALMPSQSGNANSVLTTDGTNLAWTDFTGGFAVGNITIAVADDNTISTTAGDLKLASATGEVDINAIVNITADYLNLNSDNSAFDSAMRFGGSAEIKRIYSTDSFEISKPTYVAGQVSANSLNIDSGTLFVDPTNNRVGVNTTAPLQELTVNAGGDGYCQIGMENTERTWLVTNNDGDDLVSYSVVVPSPFSVTNRLQFDAVGGDQWFNSGRLGVNTATPAYTLDVNGDVKVGGDTIYNSYDEKLIDYSQFASIYGTSRQANFQATNNIGVRASFFFIDGITELNTNSLTTSATTPDQVLSYFDQTSVEAVKSTIKVVSGGAVQCIEVLMVQDGTNISLNTYGDVRTAGNLTTVSSGYNATTGYWELRVTPVNAVTSYRVTNQIMN